MTLQIRLFLVLLFSLLVSVSCAQEPNPQTTAFSPQAQAWRLIDDGALLIDVRSRQEFESGHLKGAVNIPHDQLDKLTEKIGSEKDREVVVYCKSGRRAQLVKEALEKDGYSAVHNGIGYSSLLELKDDKS